MTTAALRPPTTASIGDNPRRIISFLLASLPATPQQSPNPLRDLSTNPSTKNTFLTLYTLFEKELLPALDLLDRNLITLLKSTNNTSLFLVRSAQQHHHNSRSTYEHVNYYTVQLDAWSCSCPAFTFSAFPANATHDVGHQSDEVFGGLTRGSDIAICKHLLACVLVRHCELFAHLVEEKEVSVEEIAGWAAGWGD